MSPEQLEGKEADARSDLWALGCVLYEMATGQRAFEGESQATLDRRDHERGARADRRAGAAWRRRRSSALVKQCLAKDPDERWQSAGDLRRELQWIADGGLARPACRRRSRRGARAARASPGCSPQYSPWSPAASLFVALRSGSRSDEQVTFRQLNFRPRGDLPGRLRSGRQDDRVQRGTRGQHARDLHRPPRVSRAAIARPARRTTPRRLVDGGAGRAHRRTLRLRTDCSPVRWLACRWAAARRARSWRMCGRPTGRRTARNSRSFARSQGKDRLEYPIGHVLCESGGYMSDRPDVSAGRPHRVLRASVPLGRSRLGERRRPRRKEDRALGGLLERTKESPGRRTAQRSCSRASHGGCAAPCTP